MVSLEELAQRIATEQENVWSAEWRRADVAAQIVQSYPREFYRAACKELGMSARTLEGFASLAVAFPPDERAADRSPRTHATWARKGGRG